MSVLLSIKPKYVDKIVAGDKKYEFRKAIFKKDVRKVYIYSSSPTKKIVGCFFLSDIIRNTPENLWAELKHLSGLEHAEFFEYFKDKTEGFAIEIGELFVFKKPIDPRICFENFVPPQSFCYFDDNVMSRIPALSECDGQIQQIPS